MAKGEKFKDTPFGKRLIKAIPNAAGFIGNLLPDQGVFGVAKRLIDVSTLTDSEKVELETERVQAELPYLKDVQNARDNETKRDVSENSSVLSKNIHEIIAMLFVIGWFVTLGWTINLFVKGIITVNQLALILAATGLKDMVLLILGYLYGRTKPQK